MNTKIIFFMIIILMPIFIIFSGCDTARAEIEVRVTNDYVQWSYNGENAWHDIISIEDIKATLGESYKGDTGDTGEQGPAGINGREVEFRANETHLQWHYVGDNNWIDLVELSKIGIDSSSENPQQLAFYPLDDGSYGVGAGNATQLSSITIPSTYLGKSVTRIVDNAFKDCGYLTQIDIPNSITEIGSCAFGGCSSLNSIAIPSSVTSIGAYAFVGGVLSMSNSSLCSVTFANDSQLAEIGRCAFYNCSTLASITIPSSVTSIGAGAFYHCYSLTNITIPSSVTNIGSDAFYHCSNLTNIYYNGTIEQWLNIKFDNSFSNPCCYGADLYINEILYNEIGDVYVPENDFNEFIVPEYNHLSSSKVKRGLRLHNTSRRVPVYVAFKMDVQELIADTLVDIDLKAIPLLAGNDIEYLDEYGTNLWGSKTVGSGITYYYYKGSLEYGEIIKLFNSYDLVLTSSSLEEQDLIWRTIKVTVTIYTLEANSKANITNSSSEVWQNIPASIIDVLP